MTPLCYKYCTQAQTLPLRLKQSVLYTLEAVLLSEVSCVQDVQSEFAGIAFLFAKEIAGAERDVSVHNISQMEIIE